MIIPFFKKCPEVGNKEMLHFALKDEEGLPGGEYSLVEAFCDNPDCDCRNTHIGFFKRKPVPRGLATINYGWESINYYISVFLDKEEARKVQGTCIIEAETPEIGDAALKLFNKILQDTDYSKKIKKHYKMFKHALREETGQRAGNFSKKKKIGRNDPCSCGSGKKYKMCCGR